VNGRLPAPSLPAFIEARLPAGVERYRLQAREYAMHVLEMGAGPPVLMLHGNPTWGFLYRKVFAELARDGLRLVAPDLVGLGYSDRPGTSREHTLDSHARWLGALLDALALDRPVVVMQDWGGPIALRVTGFAGPVAVVWGDRDPVLGRVIGWIRKLLPRASVTRTAAGHFLQEEVPREIAEAARWVAREAAAGSGR
jgi:pimeloyl-ACP methyl ester carboxylesterase